MNHIKILKRALTITINYRVLWIFGILLALTAGGGSGSGGGGNTQTTNTTDSFNFDWQKPFGALPQFTPEAINMGIGIAIGLACLILVLMVVGTIVRYVTETALFRMVDEHENSGEKLTIRQGFRLGWSRVAWKMFLMDLLVGLAFMILFLILLTFAALPLLVWLSQNTPLQIIGTIIASGLILLLVFATIIAALAVTLIMLFARRACVLGNLGVRAALRRGFQMVRQRLGDVVLMGLMMFGIGLLWIMITIPAFLVIVLVAALMAGLPALMIGSIVGLFVQGFTPWIVAAIVGTPIFLIVVIIPSALISGWQQVFSSSAWTLTYRETLALEQIKMNGELPAPENTVKGSYFE